MAILRVRARLEIHLRILVGFATRQWRSGIYLSGRGIPVSSPLPPEVVRAKSAEAGRSDMPCINAQMQVALVASSPELLTVVNHSSNGQGPDAERRLNRECEPGNEVAILSLVQRCCTRRRSRLSICAAR